MHIEGVIRNRLGMLALAISGLLYSVTLLLRGPLVVDPIANPSAFTQAVTATNYVAWALGSAVANIFHLLGVLGLYAYLSASPVARPPFWALILNIIHDTLFPLFLGFSLFLPAIGKLYLQGQTSKAAPLSAPILSTLTLGGVLFLVGAILYSVAIWRSGRLSKWTAIPFALAPPLLVFGPSVSFIAEFMGAVLLAVSGLALTADVWRHEDKKG